MDNNTPKELVPESDLPPPAPKPGPPSLPPQPAEPRKEVKTPSSAVSPAETIAVIVLACLADFLLYKTLGGMGAGLLLLAALAAVTGLLGSPRGLGQLSLFVFVALCSGMMVWRHWWLLEVMGWTSVFILAAKRKVAARRIPEALLASTGTFLVAPVQMIAHFANLARCFKKPKESAKKKDFPLNAVFIPIGICIVFLVIFCNANPVVARIVKDFLANISDFFNNIWKHIAIERFVLWLLWLGLFSALTAPLLRHVISDRLLAARESLDKNLQPKPGHDHALTAMITLVAVNVMFLCYNCLDSVYLYFKATLPEGITWTAYTHAGCGWLTFGLFISTLTLAVIFRGPLNFCASTSRLKVLSYVWAVQNVFLAVGAIRRLQMYIDYSGLTHLRITGIYGSVLVAVGLVIMARKVQMNRGAVWMLRSYALAFYTAVAILAITPNDYWCSRYNVKRIREGKPRALRPVMLKKLSAEALPQLIPLLDEGAWYESEEKTTVIRKGIAGLLSKHLETLDQRDTDWRKWQGSQAWALRRFEKRRDQLKDICPPAERAGAVKTLATDYDLQRKYPSVTR